MQQCEEPPFHPPQVNTQDRVGAIKKLQSYLETRPGDLVICRTHWDNFVVKTLTIFYHFRQYKSQSKL